MKKSSEPVRPRMISRAAMKSCDRSRNVVMERQAFSLYDCSGSGASRRKFVSGAVHGHQKTRRGRIRLQLLAQAKHVIVDGSGGGIILIAPDLVEQFFAG